jgi:hypothetical protein
MLKNFSLWQIIGNYSRLIVIICDYTTKSLILQRFIQKIMIKLNRCINIML